MLLLLPLTMTMPMLLLLLIFIWKVFGFDGIYQANAILNKFECCLLCGSAYFYAIDVFAARLLMTMMEMIMKFYSILFKKKEKYAGLYSTLFPHRIVALKFLLVTRFIMPLPIYISLYVLRVNLNELILRVFCRIALPLRCLYFAELLNLKHE